MAGTANNKPDNKPGSNKAAQQRHADKENAIDVPRFSITGIRGSLIHSTFMQVVLLLLIAIFAVSFLFMSRLPSNGLGGNGPAGTGGPDPVARAAGTDISRAQLNTVFENQYEQMQQFGQKPGPTELVAMKQQALTTLANNASEAAAATAAGITVSDKEIDAEIAKQIDDQIKQQKAQGEAQFRRNVEAQYPGGEKDLRTAMVANFDRDAVRQSLLVKKFQDSVKAANKVTEDDYKRSVTKLNLSQIIVRPALPGPKEKDFKAAADKNAAAAKAKAAKLVDELKGKTGPALAAAFAALAKTESDDSATKAKGGSLGWELPSQLPLDPNTQATVAAAKSGVVGPLSSEGSQDQYIFLVDGSKVDLPKDYAKKKATYIKGYKDQRDSEVWSKKQDEIHKANPPKIYDPELLAYQTQTDDMYKAPADQQNGLRQKAIGEYQEALGYASDLEAASIRCQMAQLYEGLNDMPKAIETLQEAIKGQGNVPTVVLELARDLQTAKRPHEAILQLDNAAKLIDQNPSTPSPFGGGNPDDQLRMQLAAAYDQLGEKKSAEEQRKKIKPQAPGGMGGMDMSRMLNIPAH